MYLRDGSGIFDLCTDSLELFKDCLGVSKISLIYLLNECRSRKRVRSSYDPEAFHIACMLACMTVCMPVCLSAACLPVSMPHACLRVRLHARPPVVSLCPYACLCPSVGLPVWLRVDLSTCLLRFLFKTCSPLLGTPYGGTCLRLGILF